MPLTCGRNYHAIRSTSIGWDTKFTLAFFIHFVRLYISQPGLYTDRHEILHGGSAISDRSSPILGYIPRDG